MMSGLILRFLVVLFPHAESLQCLLAQQRQHGFVAVGGLERYFVVDKVVVEANGGGILAVVGIIDLVDACPIDGTQTHGAWLARGVDLTAREVERAQTLGGAAYAVDLSMCCGVVVYGHAV